jgi:hypothetical protein
MKMLLEKEQEQNKTEENITKEMNIGEINKEKENNKTEITDTKEMNIEENNDNDNIPSSLDVD